VIATQVGRTLTLRRIQVVGGVALLVVLLAGCMTPDEGTGFNLLNADRVANGVARVKGNDAATVKAHDWAVHLASASGGACTSSTLSHSNLASGAPAGWRSLGENVACRTVSGSVADAVAPLEAQLMASPGHHANIVASRYTHAGVGIAAVSIGTNRWVVFEAQFFVQL
jgi:uncharacterized protein YkwD